MRKFGLTQNCTIATAFQLKLVQIQNDSMSEAINQTWATRICARKILEIRVGRGGPRETSHTDEGSESCWDLLMPRMVRI